MHMCLYCPKHATTFKRDGRIVPKSLTIFIFAKHSAGFRGPSANDRASLALHADQLRRTAVERTKRASIKVSLAIPKANAERSKSVDEGRSLGVGLCKYPESTISDFDRFCDDFAMTRDQAQDRWRASVELIGEPGSEMQGLLEQLPVKYRPVPQEPVDWSAIVADNRDELADVVFQVDTGGYRRYFKFLSAV